MISNAPEEVTSNSNDIPLTTTTMKAPITVTYHHVHNLPDDDESEEESLLTTLFEGIVGKSTIDVIASTTMTPSTNAPEAETIFPPINNIHNNEHHHNAFDEKLPIVIATAAVS